MWTCSWCGYSGWPDERLVSSGAWHNTGSALGRVNVTGDRESRLFAKRGGFPCAGYRAALFGRRSKKAIACGCRRGESRRNAGVWSKRLTRKPLATSDSAGYIRLANPHRCASYCGGQEAAVSKDPKNGGVDLLARVMRQVFAETIGVTEARNDEAVRGEVANHRGIRRPVPTQGTDQLHGQLCLQLFQQPVSRTSGFAQIPMPTGSLSRGS